MKDSVYIIVNKHGFVNARKTNQFTLQPGERAFKLAIQIPDSVFNPAAVPTVTVNVPEPDADWGDAITAEII